ncbi:MAG: class I SAM-dependent methyltransferase, partial [Bacteroidota bacterium]
MEVLDLGAGSHKLKSHRRKVSQIARSSGISPKKGRLLFRLVNYFQPQQIIELGTSLGLSSLYMGRANSKSHILSLEGCPQLAARAQQGFDAFGLERVDIKVGDIGEQLPNLLQILPRVDFVYLDANHQYKATRTYFEMLLDRIKEESVLVLDDINWSPGMQKAWQEIIAHPQVSISLDLF